MVVVVVVVVAAGGAGAGGAAAGDNPDECFGLFRSHVSFGVERNESVDQDTIRALLTPASSGRSSLCECESHRLLVVQTVTTTTSTTRT